jgi:DNA-binding winged helix-turn-helix (wHTH) protein
MPTHTFRNAATVAHLHAGLRTLSATMIHFVDVYINYLRRKVDTGYHRVSIRTIRGVGYQIGGSGNTAARKASASAVALSSR